MRRALLAVTAVVAAALPACSSGGGGGYELVAWFDKAVSLYEQSDVKVLGLSAGTVEEIEVVDTLVRVRMTIRDDQPVPPDVRATIVPLSLIGERYVQLFPVWQEGQPRAEPGTEIPVERTTIPTEPDEALAALKKFLDALDPNATGRLVRNLAADLDGNGQGINDALGGLADLTGLLASKDAELVGIIEHFDRFTATLRTRERQIGTVMDQFAGLTSLLAEERGNVEKLVDALARISVDGLDLVGEHGARLDRDLTVITRLLQSVRANLKTIDTLLEATPIMVAGKELDGTRGLAGAWDRRFHHIDLRNATTPTLAALLDEIGINSNPVCIDGIDVDCEATPLFPPATASRSRTAPSPTTPTFTTVLAGRSRPDNRDLPARTDGEGLLGTLRRGARVLLEVVS